MPKPVFVHQRTHKTTRASEIVLARETVRECMVRWPEYRWEQIRMFQLIQDARKVFPNAKPLFKKLTSGHTPLSLALIRFSKLGKKNPNAKGIPEERKAKIRRTMQAKDRRQVRNPFYGKHHTAEARAKISKAAKKRRYKWACQPPGIARRVPKNFVLPVGWRWGHGGFRVKA
jgi:hypothetical protein